MKPLGFQAVLPRGAKVWAKAGGQEKLPGQTLPTLESFSSTCPQLQNTSHVRKLLLGREIRGPAPSGQRPSAFGEGGLTTAHDSPA